MKRPVRLAVQLVPALPAFGLLLFVLRGADADRVLGLVHSLGWRLPLLLLPNLLVMSLEATGWWIALARLATRPRLRALLGIRLAGEALMLGLPSGSMVNDSMQPYLLRRRCGVPLETAIVATIGRKFLVVLSHGLFLALATLLTWPALDRASHTAIGRGGLPWLLLSAAAVLTGSALAGALASAHGRLAERIHRRLDRWGGRWLRTWLERNAFRFARTDAALASFFARRRAGLVPPLLLYLLAWLVRALETLLFLSVLGVHVSLPAAMVIETALILLRAMAVPVPAGLGIQDLGYVLSFRALGLPDVTTIAAAFIVMKRGKDLFWILLGFVVLGLGDRRDAARP
jgi:uncharacterized protein (TIRG00374 family)